MQSVKEHLAVQRVLLAVKARRKTPMKRPRVIQMALKMRVVLCQFLVVVIPRLTIDITNAQ